MNILRDPPKSIQTRRIDKIQDTALLSEMIDGASDRISDCIQIYSRGVNPSVAVSYSNNGTNGGYNVPRGLNTVQSSLQNRRFPVNAVPLTYKTNDDGAFRPPIKTPWDLLPLSRLPRGHIKDVLSSKSFQDWMKSKPLPPPLTKTVELKQLLQAYQPLPKQIRNIEKPLEFNFHSKDSINDKHINVSASSGQNTQDTFERNQWVNDNHVSKPILEAWADTNQQRARIDTATSLEHLNTGQFIQHPVHYDVSSGSSVTPSDVFIGEMAAPNLNSKLMATNVVSNVSDSRVYHHIPHENEVVQFRNTPLTSIESNATNAGLETFDAIANRTSRDASREIKRHLVFDDYHHGTIDTNAKQSFERTEQPVRTGNSERLRMRQLVLDQQLGRN